MYKQSSRIRLRCQVKWEAPRPGDVTQHSKSHGQLGDTWKLYLDFSVSLQHFLKFGWQLSVLVQLGTDLQREDKHQTALDVRHSTQTIAGTT